MVQEKREEREWYSQQRVWSIVKHAAKVMFANVDVPTLQSSGIIYNMAWEDNRVDQRILRLGAGDVFATITTGGDNVLNALMHDVAEVWAVDMNPCQNHLLELKMACMRQLTCDQFMCVFGKHDLELLNTRWAAVRAHLSPQAAAYWDDKKNRQQIGHFVMCGAVGTVARFFKNLFSLMGMGSLFDVLKSGGMAEQKAWYTRHRTRVRMLTSVAYRLTGWLAPYAGVPARQLEMIDSNYLNTVFDYLFTRTQLNRNPYFGPYLLGYMHQECCPDFMRREHYNTIKARLDRVRVRTGMIQEEIPATVTKMSLLDHMDWLPEAAVAAEWDTFVRRCPDALIMWRSATSRRTFLCLEHLQYVAQAPPHDAKTQDAYGVDRLGTYWGCWAARIPPSWGLAPARPPGADAAPDLRTFSQMVLPRELPWRRWSGTHADTLDSFYACQAEKYDAYRVHMLHGRPHLMRALPAPSKGARWLDVGGGTGFNLEYTDPTAWGEVVVLDLCQSLLNVAQKRIQRHGWSHVRAVAGDAETWTDPDGFDLITFSYSLTMIPRWRQAIDNAVSMLRPGGVLGLTDFTIGPMQRRASAAFIRRMFRADGVRLSEEHLPYISQKMGHPGTVMHGYGGFPFTPGVRAAYYAGLWRKAPTAVE